MYIWSYGIFKLQLFYRYVQFHYKKKGKKYVASGLVIFNDSTMFMFSYDPQSYRNTYNRDLFPKENLFNTCVDIMKFD